MASISETCRALNKFGNWVLSAPVQTSKHPHKDSCHQQLIYLTKHKTLFVSQYRGFK